MDEEKKIVIISDGTGRTAQRLMDAVLAQYAESNLEFSLVNVYPQVRDRAMFDRILKQIEDDYLVIFSIISADLSQYFCEKLSERGILHINVLDPMLKIMRKFLGVHPGYKPGILQVIDDRYYKKVDAIGFTVRHDDGKGQHVEDADVVLLGLSRTCKTPISMYLACNYGLKVANIPVVRNAVMTENLLRRLDKVDKKSVMGLLMQPETLAKVREERSMIIAEREHHHNQLDSYYDIREVAKEFRFSRDLFEVRGWETVDVTRRAIEEVSLEILEKLGKGED